MLPRCSGVTVLQIRPDLGYINKSPAQKLKLASTNTAYKTLASNFNIALLQCAMTSGKDLSVLACSTPS